MLRAITVSLRCLHLMCFILGKPEHEPIEFFLLKKWIFLLSTQSTNRANYTDTFESSSYKDILGRPEYDPDHPTYFFIHGLNQTQNGITVTVLVVAFAERGGNNFVSLNWPAGNVVGSILQVGLSYLNSYNTVMEVSTTPDFNSHSIERILSCVSFQVGRVVGADLYSTCPSDELPHVIGHSLGGQLAHVIGQTFISMGGKLDRYVQLRFYTEPRTFMKKTKTKLELQLRTQLRDFF